MSATAPSASAACLAEALSYATAGWPVFPLHCMRGSSCSCGDPACSRRAKHPRTRFGCKEASRDPDQVYRWWREHPDANVGIATGAASGLLILDVDPEHAGDDSLFDLERRLGPLPDTRIVLTGGGGQHFYFRHPNCALKNSVGILPGLDLRTEGGYVVAPPSNHSSGGVYCWEVGTEDLPIAELPQNWLQFFRERAGIQAALQQKLTADDRWTVRYGEGTRNSSVFKQVCRWRAQGLEHTELLLLASAFNKSCCVPPLSEEEIKSIVASGAHYPRGTAFQSPLAPDKPLVPVAVSDLLGRSLAAPPSLIGEGVLIPQGFLLLAGPPGAGKSWAALDLLLSASLGLTWLEAALLPVKRCRALLVAMELPDYVMKERLEAVIDARGITGESENLDALMLTLPRYDQVALDSESGPQNLIKLIQEEGIELLLLDPFSRLHLKDENSAQEMGVVLKAIDEIRAVTHCAVILIHHVRKGSGLGRGGATMDSVRGSGRLISDTQTVLGLEERSNHLALMAHKLNFGPPLESISLSRLATGPLLANGLGAASDYSEEKRRNVEWTQQALLQAPPTGLRPTDLLSLEGHPAVKEETIRKYLRELRNRGLVESRGAGKRTRWHAVVPSQSQEGSTESSTDR